MNTGYSNKLHKHPRFRIYGRTYIEVWSLKAFWKQDVKKPPAAVPKKNLDSRKARR